MKNHNRLPTWIILLWVPLILLLQGATLLPDPTRPPGFAAASAASNQRLEVTAIFIYPQYRVAIIAGQAVKVGDHIREYTVTTIDQNAVELVGPKGTEEVLPLTVTVKQVRP